MTQQRVVVVGAGIGGLTAAALLAQSGLHVTVLEAHVYPGGCAGTFFHQGYRFDAGATLAAGFEPGGGMSQLGEKLGMEWPVKMADCAMSVILPDGAVVNRWTDPARWRDERIKAFGDAAEPFWHWQERTADLLWAAALQGVPWPPQGGGEWARLGKVGLKTIVGPTFRRPGLVLDAVRSVASHLPATAHRLRQYVDGQLLISAQTLAGQANAFYGAAALDMPRRGVAHVDGGIGKLADCLVEAVRRHGGTVHLRHRVTDVKRGNDGLYRVQTARDNLFLAEHLLLNLPPWDASALLGPPGATIFSPNPILQSGWGAFMIYVGLDGSLINAPRLPLHTQVLKEEPYGEGNSLFLSLSLPGDRDRAPQGGRALTISTHTRLDEWWTLWHNDRDRYETRKRLYADRVLDAAEIAIPGLRRAAQLILPGTPVTFQRFTRRYRGWVGGFPQTSLFRARGPRFGRNLWLVGDSVFPGQSVLAVALGGERVAAAVRSTIE